MKKKLTIDASVDGRIIECGEPIGLDVLQSVSFHTGVLGWSGEDWEFKEGEFPALKNAD